MYVNYIFEQEIAELDRVEGLNCLLEISLVNNPVSMRIIILYFPLMESTFIFDKYHVNLYSLITKISEITMAIYSVL